MKWPKIQALARLKDLGVMTKVSRTASLFERLRFERGLLGVFSLVALSPSIPRVAIIRSSSIGDVVLASACLDLAEKMGVSIVWLGRSPALRLIAEAHADVVVVEMPRSIRSSVINDVLTKIGPIDAIVDLQSNVRSRAYLRHASSKIAKIKVPKYRWKRLRMLIDSRIRHRLFPVPRDRRIPETYQYRTMLDAFAEALKTLNISDSDLGQKLQGSRPNLKGLVARTVHPSWGNDLSFGRWLALAPGAAHPTKECKKDVWLEVLRAFMQDLSRHGPVGLLLVGGDADRRMSVEILDRLSWPWSVLNLTGKLTLSDTATALSRAELLLTNDSGLLHIAEAVGTPVCAVYGPTVEDFGFAPWHPESISVSSDLGCRPCSRHGKTPCRYRDKLCFDTLPTYRIQEKLRAVFLSPMRARSLDGGSRR